MTENIANTALQHGDPVESWTIHTHSVLIICPKCRQPVSRTYQSCYKFDMLHVVACACGQGFGVKWLDNTQDAQITIYMGGY